MISSLGPDRPFPGLRPYAAADHAWFFGRDEQSLALYRLLDRGRLVAVVGSSGSGKSSVVRAGVLPLLDEETRAAGGRRWQWWELRPGDAPIARLAETLAGGLGAEADQTKMAVRAARRERVEFLLRKSSFGLLDALREVGLEPGTTPLVLVDQFEELFRFADLPGTEAARAARREEAAAFVQLLLEAARASKPAVRIVLTMRSDYLGDSARFHGLPEALTASQFLVPSLTRDQRERAIRGPIGKAGGSIADELVERLLNDSSEELDQLPVLQHALMRIWEMAGEERAPRLTLDDYRKIGGTAGAISQHASALLGEPELRDRELAVEQVFRALAELDRQGRGIRRPLPFAQLVEEAGQPEADVRAVVDRFRRDDCSFLVPPFAADRRLAGKDIVDIGHEALIRRWARMNRIDGALRAGWLWDEAADGRAYRGLLAFIDGAQPSHRATLPVGQLGPRWRWWQERPRTAAWAERYDGRLPEVERLFTYSRWRAWLAQGAMAVVAMLLAGSAVAVLVSWRRAEQRAAEATAGLIWSRIDFEDTNDPQSLAAVRALWELTTGPAAVRDAFLRQLAQDRYQVDTLAAGPTLIARAFGLRSSSTDVIRLLLPILDAIGRTTNFSQLSALAEAAQALGPKLGPEQAGAALGRVLDAISRATGISQLSVLAEAAQALGPKLGPEQAGAALGRVLDAIGRATDFSQLRALAEAAQALGSRVTADVAGRGVEVLRTPLAMVDVPDTAAALARALSAMLPAMPPEKHVSISVELLKWPTVVGPVADALLEALAARFPQAPRKEAGLDAAVAWLADTWPSIDLTSPPSMPPSGATGDGF